MSSSPDAPPPKITGYSFILSADSQKKDGEKTTFLNVEYEYLNSVHHAQIPMLKEEFAEIRGDLNGSSRIIDFLLRRH